MCAELEEGRVATQRAAGFESLNEAVPDHVVGENLNLVGIGGLELALEQVILNERTQWL